MLLTTTTAILCIGLIGRGSSYPYGDWEDDWTTRTPTPNNPIEIEDVETKTEPPPSSLAIFRSPEYSVHGVHHERGYFEKWIAALSKLLTTERAENERLKARITELEVEIKKLQCNVGKYQQLKQAMTNLISKF